jgi:hypothetical protein
MRAARCMLLFACAHEPASHVEILPLPSGHADDASVAWPEEPGCEPEALEVVETGANGALDTAMLRDRLGAARKFAERCCTGDESGDATVSVTFAPEGYGTTVSVEPVRLATGAPGACLSASFHRVTTKSFSGAPVTVTTLVHVIAR